MSEAEKQVLSAWIARHEYIDELPEVAPEDFKDRITQQIAKIIYDQHASGMGTDLPELAEKLEFMGLTNGDDGDWFLVLMSWERDRIIFGAESYSKYASEVKESAALRILYANIARLAEDIRSKTKPFTEIVGSAQAITEGLNYSDDTYEVLSLEDAYMDAYLHLNSVSDGSIAVINTGLASLDAATGGMSPGQMTVLAARPGVGKTMLSWFIAENIGRQSKVLFVPLEMEAKELCARGFTHHLGRTISDFTARSLGEKTWGKMMAVRESMRDSKMFIAPKIRTIEQLEYMVRKQRPELVTLDYMQLLGTRTRFRSKYEQISEISRRLKLLARDYSCHVMALCQLNREAAKGEPRMEHLRDSGTIEQDADRIILLSNIEDGDSDSDQAEQSEQRIKITLDKNRQGSKGELEIIFDYEKMRYYEESEAGYYAEQREAN